MLAETGIQMPSDQESAHLFPPPPEESFSDPLVKILGRRMCNEMETSKTVNALDRAATVSGLGKT
jgi:hypothetical protein